MLTGQAAVVPKALETQAPSPMAGTPISGAGKALIRLTQRSLGIILLHLLHAALPKWKPALAIIG